MEKMSNEEKERFKAEIMKVLSRHVGKNNAVSMGHLHTRVLGEYDDDAGKINGTRRIRYLVTELRNEGIPICSYSGRHGGGYYLAAAGSELKGYCASIRGRALRILEREANLRKMTVPQLLGEMQLEFGEAALIRSRLI